MPSLPSLILHLALLLLRGIMRLLRRPSRLLSLVFLKDAYLTLRLLLAGLRPVAVECGKGTSLSVWAPPRGARGRRPAVLLVHGFGADAKWQWEYQLAHLAARFDLYLPDLVFFGRSRSDSRRRSVAFQAECLSAAMAQMGVEKYSVVGISYGGFVAYAMAAAERLREPVEKVVIMTTGVHCTAAELRGLVEKEGVDVSNVLLPRCPEELRTLVRRSMYRPPIWMPDFFLRDFIQTMYVDGRKERVELLAELLDKGVNLDPFPVLTQESLIIWGDKDGVFPLDLACRLHRHLGPEKCRLEFVQDAGHALICEKPDAVNRIIERFILSTEGKKSA